MSRTKTRYTWRRGVQATYLYMIKKLGDPSSLSTRKQMSLAYMKWGYTCKIEDRNEFVRLAKLFRKEENRQGGNRTILEMKARKHFKEARKHSNREAQRQAARKVAESFMREGKGIHSEEVKKSKPKRPKRDGATEKKERKGHHVVRKYLWRCRNLETGEVVETGNLKLFREEHDIPQSSNSMSLKVEERPMHGWLVERYNPDW